MTKPTPLPEGPDLERRLEAVEMSMSEDFYRAAPPGVAEALGIEASRDGGMLRLTVRGIDHPFFNRIMGVGLDGPGEAVLDGAVEHYRSAGVRRWMLQVPPHAETDAFRSACRVRGAVRLRGWAKHVGSTGARPATPTELRIEPAGDRGAAWAGVVQAAYGFPDPVRPWLAALAERDRWSLFLALDGDLPAAGAALYLASGTAGPPAAELTFAATLPEHRGLGAQSALVARRLEEARSRGVHRVVTETDEERPDRPNPSCRNLVRLGLPVRYVRANWGPPKPEA